MRSERIVLQIPARCVRTRLRPENNLEFEIDAVRGAATVNLSTSLLTERMIADLAADELSFDVLLENDTYAGDVATAAAEDVLAGIVAGVGGEPTDAGWAAVVQASLSAFDLARIDDTTLRVRLPHFASYAISRPETITCTLPASAVLSRKPIVATPSFLIMAEPGSAVVSGSLLARLSQTIVNAGNATLRVRLADETFSDALLAGTPAVLDAVLQGLDAVDAAPAGWAATVRPVLDPSMIRLLAATELELTLPPVPLYSLAEPEVSARAPGCPARWTALPRPFASPVHSTQAPGAQRAWCRRWCSPSPPSRSAPTSRSSPRRAS